MTQSLKSEVKTLSGLVTPDIVVASTSVATLLGGELILGSDGSPISGRLTIPEYQRPYRWQVKHLQRLLLDLTEYFSLSDDAIPPEHDFYLGSIIIHQARPPRMRSDVLSIIDGQQRLITLALIAHVLKQRDLAKGIELTSPESQARALYNLRWLEQQQLPAVDFSRVNITLVVTRSEDDAYRFFETQNTGGVRLDGPAILKAHHLRGVPQQEQDKQARRWEAWGALDGTVDALMKARHWQLLKWRSLSSHRQPLQTREEIVAELAERTGQGRDIAYRTARVHHIEQGQHLQVDSGYAMRQPLNTGVNAIHYFDYFHVLRRTVLVRRDDPGLAPFHQLYDHLVVQANGSEFLRKLFDCAVLLYVSQFGRQGLLEAACWLFRAIFSPRLSNEKAVRESTAQSFAEHNPVLDWIAHSYTHAELIETLQGFSYLIAERLDANSVKYRFVRTVQAYFSMNLSAPGEALQSDFDTALKQAISRKFQKSSFDLVGEQ
ncbi:DUF262 domain-containing protein [Pseudomonas sp. zjy_9]|uniref:DUF262 domain-containing protein n=1 Tax=Pseudomonas sp. yb_5 TaxID=3367220 RepID=UPI00370A9211